MTEIDELRDRIQFLENSNQDSHKTIYEFMRKPGRCRDLNKKQTWEFKLILHEEFARDIFKIDNPDPKLIKSFYDSRGIDERFARKFGFADVADRILSVDCR